jgi:hypothetical protein
MTIGKTYFDIGNYFYPVLKTKKFIYGLIIYGQGASHSGILRFTFFNLTSNVIKDFIEVEKFPLELTGSASRQNIFYDIFRVEGF